ncbi:MAG: fibro-slime domain-containing protein [Phycisphaerales bacterium JB039]
MNRGPTNTILALALVGAAATSALGQSSFALRGTIRDFVAAHPDFGVAPTGHFPNNLDLILRDGEPVYTAFGFEAVSQWRDRLSRPIAPNMYNSGRVVVELVSAPSINQKSYVDSFDAYAGPFVPDPKNPGPEPDFLTGSPMPTLTAPSLSVPWQASFIRDKKEISTLSTDIHCDEFRLRNGHTLQIDGDVRVLCETNFELNNSSNLILLPGARLRVYYRGTASIEQATGTGGGTIGSDPTDCRRLIFYNLGTEPFIVRNHTNVYATVISPNAPFQMDNNCDFFGQVTAHSLDLSNSSALHIDGVPSMCSIVVEDTAGIAGDWGGAITSADSFEQWFHDALGVNSSRYHSVVMRDWGSGYEHRDDAFYPIDGKMYGNEGDAHNKYFTFDVKATFTYEACVGQTIFFEGSDDCWIFINDRLVIDLGGVEPGVGQVFEVDRLNLVDGESYDFRLLYAHRSTGTPRFNLRTTFELVPDPIETGIAAYPIHD